MRKSTARSAKGTTFKLYLPRFRGEGRDEDTPTQTGESRQADDGEVVLVVEDALLERR